MLKLLSIPLAVFGYTILSTGFVFQKKGIGWIGYKGTKNRAYYRNLFIWIVGFLLMNLNIVPNAMALKHLDPHIVAAMAGWGIIVMVFLSAYLLKEQILRSDIFFTSIIVLSIILLNLFEITEAEEVIARPYLLAAILLPFIILVPAVLRSISRDNSSYPFRYCHRDVHRNDHRDHEGFGIGTRLRCRRLFFLPSLVSLSFIFFDRLCHPAGCL